MNILFAAQDPGSANVLIPLARKAIEGKDEVKILAALYAPKIFKRYKLPCVDCEIEDVEKELAAFSPDIVATGTSMGESIEKKLTLLARKRGIKTVSVIDYWTNYSLRFSDTSDPKNLVYLSDIVCVIDEQMKRGCVKAGIPAKRIKITGSPYLEECVKKINAKGKERNQLLFISQPLSEPPYNTLPFDELSVLRDLLHYKHIHTFKKIIIRPHPKETSEKFQKFLLNENAAIPVEIKKETAIYPLISSSRIIFGMDSIVLMEASLAGKIAIRYQPSLKKRDDSLPYGLRSLSKSLYTREELYSYLDAVNEKKKEKPLVKNFSAHATENIYALLKQMNNE